MFWSSGSLFKPDIDAISLYSPRSCHEPYVAGVQGLSFGAGFGYSKTAGIASVAEYIERRHFLYRVPVFGRRAIQTFAQAAPSLLNAYQQVWKPSIDPLTIGEEMVNCAWSIELAEWQPILLPRNLISMGFDGSTLDEILNPYRDSSGMAASNSAEQAVASALFEFIERQTWIASWLGGGNIEKIRLKSFFASEQPWNILSSTPGEFEAYWLDAGLGGYTVFVTHTNENAPEHSCFACGLACAETPKAALQKALSEADHYRQFVTEKYSSSQILHPKSGGRMDRNAAQFQSRNCLKKIPLLRRVGEEIDYAAFAARPEIPITTLLASLTSVSKEVFLYVAEEINELNGVFLAKVFSPAFYLHCDPGVSLNFSNSFSKMLKIDVPTSELTISTCLP